MEDDTIDFFFYTLIKDKKQQQILQLISQDLSDIEILEQLLEQKGGKNND